MAVVVTTVADGAPDPAIEVNARLDAIDVLLADDAADLATLDGRVTTNETDIATNTADIATNVTDIATNTADIATNTADIGALETELGTNPRDKLSWSYAGTAQRDAANPTPGAGNIAYVEASDTLTVYDGAAWWPINVRQLSATASGTTNGSGYLAVTFSQAFGTAPQVLCQLRSTANRIIVTSSITTSGFTARLYDADAGTALTSTAITFDYWAIE